MSDKINRNWDKVDFALKKLWKSCLYRRAIEKLKSCTYMSESKIMERKSLKPNYRHIFHIACRTGDIDKVKYLFDRCPEIIKANIDESLLVAIKHDNHDLVNLLLNHYQVGGEILYRSLNTDTIANFEKIVSFVANNIEIFRTVRIYGYSNVIKNKYKYYQILYDYEIPLSDDDITDLICTYIEFGNEECIIPLCDKLARYSYLLVRTVIYTENINILIYILNRDKLSGHGLISGLNAFHRQILDNNLVISELIFDYIFYDYNEVSDHYKRSLNNIITSGYFASNIPLNCLHLYLQYKPDYIDIEKLSQNLDEISEKGLLVCHIQCLLFRRGTIDERLSMLGPLSKLLFNQYGNFLLLKYPRDILHYILKIMITLP